MIRKDPPTTEAIKTYLDNVANPELAALYHSGMEVQINPLDTGGELIRIPYDAKGTPHYHDPPLDWLLQDHAKFIGLTGYNWKDRVSEWVGFDFDDCTHTGGNPLAPEKLERVLQAAKQHPNIEIRKSKGGQGYHFYVHFAIPIPTENHTVHSALARAVLQKLGEDIGFAFNDNVDDNVDGMGMVLWIWAREIGPGGFERVKSGTPLEEVPFNWRSYIPAPAKQQNAVKEFSTEQQRLIDFLETLSYETAIGEINGEIPIVKTRSVALKEAKQALKLSGDYETKCVGTDSKPNCYLIPLPDDEWLVIYYQGQKRDETDNWRVSKAGNLTTRLNEKSKSKGKTNLERALAVTESDILFQFEDKAYATTGRATYQVRSKLYKANLRQRYYQVYRKALKQSDLSDVIAEVEARALVGPEQQVYMRVAHADAKIYISLCNDEWEVIEIDSDGWRIAPSPVCFVRHPGMLALPRPQPGGSIDMLRRFVNVTDEGWGLVVTYIIGAYGYGPKPILVAHGRGGSCKTYGLRRILILMMLPCGYRRETLNR